MPKMVRKSSEWADRSKLVSFIVQRGIRSVGVTFREISTTPLA